MHQELDALLCTRYPAIFLDEEANGPELFGFECGDGWFTLIDAACQLIQRHVDATDARQPMASQVKEKFGGLRFYCRRSNDYTGAVVDLVESLSSHVCEVCGALGKTVSLFGWVHTRCDLHESTTVYEESAMRAVRDSLMLAPPMAELLGACLAFFEHDGQAAARWLTQPALVLGRVVPLALAGSEDGLRQVLTLIGRLEHGITP